jgi:hypothetical protein
VTTPLFGTDPLLGYGFAFGQRLRSAQHMNVLMSWFRNLDAALEASIAKNWPYTGTGFPGAGATPADSAAYDATLKMWNTVGNNGAGAPSGEYSYDGRQWAACTVPAGGGTMLQLNAVASNRAGTFVAGGAPQVAGGTDKYRRTTDGITYVAAASTYNDTKAVNCVCWAPTTALFVAGLDAAGAIETSPTGAVWTAQATPGACAGYTWRDCAANEAGRIVLVSASAGSTNFATSVNGVAWAATVVAADSWYEIACSRLTNRWLAIGATQIHQSSDGITFATGTATMPAGLVTPTGLTCTGNLFVLSFMDGGGNSHVVVTDDWGATWKRVFYFGGGSMDVAYGQCTAGGGMLVATTGAGAYASHRVEI